MKKAIIILSIFFIGFVLLFLLRLGYGYYQYPTNTTNETVLYQPRGSVSNFNFAQGVQNIAAKKYKAAPSPVIANRPLDQRGINQKYEKIANIGINTKEYDNDEQKMRNIIQEKQALIQYEKKLGLKGNRTLNLVLGVPPNNFDATVAEFKKIGTASSFDLIRNDKTNEYKKLKAEKDALEKSKTSLEKLKQMEASVNELIQLENRILILEQQIQSFGVSLGDFDSEYEFVTLKIVLNEAKAIQATAISMKQRLFKAFEWTIKHYTFLTISFFALSFACFMSLLVVRMFTSLYQRLF